MLKISHIDLKNYEATKYESYYHSEKSWINLNFTTFSSVYPVSIQDLLEIIYHVVW